MPLERICPKWVIVVELPKERYGLADFESIANFQFE
jgi:hypothetical protein